MGVQEYLACSFDTNVKERGALACRQHLGETCSTGRWEERQFRYASRPSCHDVGNCCSRTHGFALALVAGGSGHDSLRPTVLSNAAGFGDLWSSGL
eukprot:2095186-Amphidinium_carterae.1